MRKPRNYDAELKSLADKARQLKERKTRQLGELVIATGADALPVEELAGALLSATESDALVTREELRKRGEGFFRGARGTGQSARRNARRASQSGSGPQSVVGEAGAA